MLLNAVVTLISKRILKTVVQKKSKKINNYKTINIFKKCVQNSDFYKRCEFVSNEKRNSHYEDQRLLSQIIYTASMI